MGIHSYRNRATKRFAKGDTRGLPPQHAPKIAEILELIDSSASAAQIRAAGYRVHRLTGDRKGFSAVSVSRNLRVVFRFVDGNAYDVEVVDYHRS